METEKRHQKRLRIYAVLTVLTMAMIFIMSALDGNRSGSLSDGFLSGVFGPILESLLPKLTDQGWDYDIRKYAHMFEFFCLGCFSFLLVYEWNLEKDARLLRSTLITFLFCFLYACSDEWHQTFVPGRAGRIQDVWIDGIGFSLAVAGMTGVSFVRRKLDKGQNRE